MEVLIEKSSNSMVDFPAGHVWTNFWWLLVILLGSSISFAGMRLLQWKRHQRTKHSGTQPTSHNRPFGGPNLLEQEVPCGGQTPFFFPESNMAMGILEIPKKYALNLGTTSLNGRFSVATFDCRRIKNDKNSQNRFLSSWFWNYSNECSVKLSLIVGYILSNRWYLPISCIIK